MAAKPRKCVTLGLKSFLKKDRNNKFISPNQKSYSPFDPQLTINDKSVRFLGDASTKDVFKKSHFKFLGRWIHSDLDDKGIKALIRKTLIADMDLVSNANLSGFKKLWIYQHYVLARISWPLMIYDFDRFYIRNLDKITIPMLKKWSGIGRTVDTGLLFRSRSNFGLGLTSLVDHFSKCNWSNVNSSIPQVINRYEIYSKQNNGGSLRKPEFGKLPKGTQLSMLKRN